MSAQRSLNMSTENRIKYSTINLIRISQQMKSTGNGVRTLHICSLSNHEVRYNCTILDLHDRSVVASITDRRITSNLAIRTLQKALESQPPIKGGLILHSDQGSQFTSKAFVEFCESVNVTQSMSKAGYPYDNAPMERYFNTLKNECTNLYEFETEKALYQKVEEFAYVDYNHVRPHSFNDYRTPYEARWQRN